VNTKLKATGNTSFNFVFTLSRLSFYRQLLEQLNVESLTRHAACPKSITHVST